jgi:hypothetical protein
MGFAAQSPHRLSTDNENGLRRPASYLGLPIHTNHRFCRVSGNIFGNGRKGSGGGAIAPDLRPTSIGDMGRRLP